MNFRKGSGCKETVGTVKINICGYTVTNCTYILSTVNTYYKYTYLHIHTNIPTIKNAVFPSIIHITKHQLIHT